MSEEASEARIASLVRQHEEPASFPGLEGIGRNLARIFADALAASSASATVAAGQTSMTTLGEWREQLKAPIVVARLRIEPLHAHIAFTMPHTLLVRLVDCYFGGQGEADHGRRPVSASESAYFERFLRVLEELLPGAFARHATITATLVEDDLCCEHVPGRDDARIAVQSFSVALDHGARSHFDIVYPRSLLSGIPGLAETPAAEDQPAPADSAWQARLEGAVMQAHFPLRAVFARIEVPLTQLLELKTGDILPICLPKQVPVTVAGRHFAVATVGEAGGRTAIKIERMEKGTRA